MTNLVLGAGISGLSAAHYLLKTAQKATVIESSSNLGGWIKSIREADVLFEQGPHTVRVAGDGGPNTLALVEDLGLADRLSPIKSSHPAVKNRMIYVKKNLHMLPSSITSLLTTRPPFTKPIVSAIFQDLKAPRKVCEDESIYEFVERRLGKEIADYLITAMVRGICAGDGKEISVKFLMKSLHEAEQAHGSVVKGMVQNMLRKQSPLLPGTESPLYKKAKDEKWSIWSLDGGLQVLPTTLAASVRTQGGEIVLDAPCVALKFGSGGAVVKTRSCTYEATHVFSSLPARGLAPLLREQHPALARELAGIPTVSVAVVNLRYEGRQLDREAFGFLVPSTENLPLLGVIFDSVCFPSGGDTVLTVMMGGRWFAEHLGTDPAPQHLLDLAEGYVRDILKIASPPRSHLVSVLRDCIPQYVVGHQARVARIKQYVSQHKLPLSLIGSSFDGVGVNDVILCARRAVDNVNPR
ncbi:protoporphyrinogen oxidase [Bacillus rossius redtenbacheri]|uniref:protoporphyrinogen oxidase n=1 Tax=Bacillus rossius redtenbacheri TaxID=93214 RepID=UPI002FDCA462